MLCIGFAAGSNQDDTSQRSRDDKLSSMVFRQAQDIGVIMMDMKTIIILQEQQQRDMKDIMEQQLREMKDKVEDQKTLITQLQSDINEIKNFTTVLQLQQISQLNDVSNIKSITDFLQIQQRCYLSKEEESVWGGCEGNITGLTILCTKQNPVIVSCDGTGWVVMLRRVDNQYNFHTNGWQKYKRSFGDPYGSFWLGLENIHQYTSLGAAKLRIEKEDFDGVTTWAEYANFRVLGESTGYQLMFSGKTGSSDALADDSGAKFTTSDRNNVPSSKNCAEDKGPWWFTDCGDNSPTEEYDENGIDWTQFNKKKVEMKIRLE